MTAPPSTAPTSTSGGASPAPGPRSPAPPGRGRVRWLARSAWRQLTSMRTALLLLFLLAMAAIPGSLLPQRGVNPLEVDSFIARHPTLGPFFDRLFLFDVFAAPWFGAIYALLFVSLVGCVVPRTRMYVRALASPPPRAPAHPSRLQHGTTYVTSAAPEVAIGKAEPLLRRRRWRVVTDGATLSAEKGRLREAGNLLFHTSLLLLLAGVGLGAAYGYSGTVLVVEGSSFTNSLINYDQFTSGPLVDRAGLPPFSLKLTSFDASYQPDGTPRTFMAHVAARTDLAGAATPGDIAVNAPWRDGSAKVYLIGHGYAPHFTVRDASGRVWFDQYIPCTPRDENFTSTCTVKVPDTGLPAAGPNKRPQQLAFTGVFFPTTRLDPREGYVSAYPALQAPGLTVRALVGDLHLANGVPQNVYALDESAMQQVPVTGPAGTRRPAQVLAPGNPKQRTLTGLPGGMTLTVDDVRQFATFQIKSDPYKGLVLVAAVLLLMGLVTSLRVRRRRIWLRAGRGSDGRTLVEVGGLSRSEGDRFAAEFDDVARALARR